MSTLPDVAPFEMSKAAWIGGGILGTIAGALGKKDHPVLGALGGGLVGAILVGAIADAWIDRNYTPGWKDRNPATCPVHGIVPR